jgi:hypothetical protein
VGAEIHLAVRGQPGEYRPCSNVLVQLLAIDLVERVLSAVVHVEVTTDILIQAKRRNAGSGRAAASLGPFRRATTTAA